MRTQNTRNGHFPKDFPSFFTQVFQLQVEKIKAITELPVDGSKIDKVGEIFTVHAH